MKQFKYILVFITLVISSCNKDDNDPILTEEDLTSSLNQILENSNLPGFSVGLVKNGNPIYQRSFGFQDLENSTSYTNETIQPIGSISKTFIGVAVVKSIELGYFTLDTPINNILKKPIVNPYNPNGEIRVRHLVNHTSSLINDYNTYAESYYFLEGQNLSSPGGQWMQSFGIKERSPKTLEEFILAYFYEGGEYYGITNFNDTEPGELEVYTDVGSSLMAYLIEVASGLEYETFLRTHIFEPLQMNATSFNYDLSNKNHATLYFDKQTPLPLYGLESFPDGALKTSNNDIMKYMLDMMAGQRGESNILFSESYYELLFTETSPAYSIFWDVLGGDSYGHTGSDPGLGTVLSFNGTSNKGAFILSNFDTVDSDNEDYFDEVTEEIGDLLLTYLSN